MNIARFDSTSWLGDGAVVFGAGGFGLPAWRIAASGPNGAGYCRNDLAMPADHAREICGRITTWPAAGTLRAREDSGFDFTDAPDGQYTAQYQLYVDGVATGSPVNLALSVGSGVTISCALGQAAASGYQATVAGVVYINCALGQAAASGHQAAITTDAIIACALGEAAASGHQATVASPVAIACALGQATALGHQAGVATTGQIDCTPGIAAATGHSADIAGSINVICALGAAAGLGHQATVEAGDIGEPEILVAESRVTRIVAGARVFAIAAASRDFIITAH